ncbi:hypothetical protein NP233_g6480 [Leucocoprinus birnbaumii]|uniref:CCR4-NOT transcription complex subunit 11 n=1 Tax=Leucocoprinus birnbaumii TaxID=56174 RepID=A0AAD5YVH9_9AGAR|nr:hypothetical protein NP233_g6480 [Leucocoprinus birnbaumii]
MQGIIRPPPAPAPPAVPHHQSHQAYHHQAHHHQHHHQQLSAIQQPPSALSDSMQQITRPAVPPTSLAGAGATAMMPPSTPSGSGSSTPNLNLPFVGNGVGNGTAFGSSASAAGSRASPTGASGSSPLGTASPGGPVGESHVGGVARSNSTSSTTTSTTATATEMADSADAAGVSDPVHASVSHLLSRAYSLPCSTAAQAFAQLVQPTSRFQLALDALLPLLDSAKSVELAQRILVSFILYSLYAPYPITINPFRSVLYVAYTKEREKAMQLVDEGKESANEQLVWVLWKILRGDGNDIGPYSPGTLARSPLPAKLRAENLVLDDDMYYNGNDIEDFTYSYSQRQQPNIYGQPAPSGYNSNGTSAMTSPIIPSSAQSTTIAALARSPITSEEDRRNERMMQGMRLLLAARERALTIAEQRVLSPLINDVTSSRIITSLDLAPIVARNPSIAHPLFVGLLCNASEENSNISQFLDVLPFLPPSLASMDVMGRLLRDKTLINKIPGYSTVADLVRMEVLGRFVHECINWLERAERDEKEGLVSDDRFAKGVQNLCRFFSSLIKLRIVDPSSDADSTEMAHFTLRYSRFEDANALYRQIATSSVCLGSLSDHDQPYRLQPFTYSYQATRWPLDTPRDLEWEEPEPLYRFVFTLAATCSLWRQVAFSTPELWKAVSMEVGPDNVDLCDDILTTFLEHVGQIPLTLDLSFSPPPPEWDGQDGLERIRRTIFDFHSQKFGFIRLTAPAVEWLQGFGETFVNLEEIHLRWRDGECPGFPNHVSFRQLPRLSRLNVYNFSSHEMNFYLPSARVTHLDFFSTGFHIPLQLLLQCRNLTCFRNRSLRYTASRVYNYNYTFQTPHILPHLEEFDWNMVQHGDQSASLLNHLQLPVLRKLFIDHLELVDPIVASSTIIFFSHFRETLQSLTLHHPWAGHRRQESHHTNLHALTNCLAALPRLRKFRVKSACPCFNSLVMEVLSAKTSGDGGYLLPELKVLCLRVRGNCEFDTKLVLHFLQRRRDLNVFVLNIDSIHYESHERELYRLRTTFQRDVQEGLRLLVREGLKLKISRSGEMLEWLTDGI